MNDWLVMVFWFIVLLTRVLVNRQNIMTPLALSSTVLNIGGKEGLC